MRIFVRAPRSCAGMHDARCSGMRPEETWTIPLHIIMWVTLAVGLIMAMAVIMMH
jgi:hypothetical protein